MGKGRFFEVEVLCRRPPEKVRREISEIGLVANEQHGIRRQVPADPVDRLGGGHPGKCPITGTDGQTEGRRNRGRRFKRAHCGAAQQEGRTDAVAGQKSGDQGGLLAAFYGKLPFAIGRRAVEGVRVTEEEKIHV